MTQVLAMPGSNRRTTGSARLPGVRLVLRRVGWVAVGAAIGLAAGLGAGQLRAPLYESTAILTVSSGSSIDTFSLARGAQALARLATEPGVVASPLRDAGLPRVAADPHRFVRVQAAPDAPIISVTGSATDPAMAQDIAATVGDALAGVGPFPPFRATVVASPTLPEYPNTPTWTLPAGGAGMGVGLALVLAATVPERRRDNERVRPDGEEPPPA